MQTGATDPIPSPLIGRIAARLRDAPDDGGDARAGGDHLLNPRLSPMKAAAYRDAAVLVPLVDAPGGEEVILTVRNPALSAHAGQIAFPGGKIDAADADAAAAALREADEEIGLAPSRVEVLGYLDTYLSRTGYRIVPVVGRVRPGFEPRPSPSEVDDVFTVPASFLFDPGNVRRAYRRITGGRAEFYEIRYGERYIWGVTAGIIKTLSDRMVD